MNPKTVHTGVAGPMPTGSEFPIHCTGPKDSRPTEIACMGAVWERAIALSLAGHLCSP